ncbi:MAG: uroporphyrinogen-III synthase [Pseudomonadota bacterium]|nr:uroporphyrinogen-III synthase [Pseudomonadota bacterium]
MKQPLEGLTFALPETRQLDVLTGLIERRGGNVRRCPLVAILDTPDSAGVERWLREFVEQPPQELILLTGEGLRRLVGFAERANIANAFLTALGQTRTVTRGPKPARALKELGLSPSVAAITPTTEGVIETLRQETLENHEVGVQLYGEDPNTRLISFLQGAGAKPRPVAPYVYAPASDEQKVVDLIRELSAGGIDMILFTSQPQYRRLCKVAENVGLSSELATGLRQTKVAAVGPVMANCLESAGVRVDTMPPESFFMKPMVAEIERWLGGRGNKNST